MQHKYIKKSKYIICKYEMTKEKNGHESSMQTRCGRDTECSQESKEVPRNW